MAYDPRDLTPEIVEAQRLLREEGSSLSEAASKAGFKSVLRLNMAFKALMGTSAADYKARHSGEGRKAPHNDSEDDPHLFDLLKKLLEETELPLEAVAKKAGCGRAIQVYKAFKEAAKKGPIAAGYEEGMLAPQRYRRSQKPEPRIAQAQTLLLYTEYSMPEIQKKCGFNSRQSFYGLFERHVGMSPRKYREAVRQQSTAEHHPSASL